MQKENVLIFLLIKIIVKGEKKMKKIYNKPTMILVKMETEHFIAASPGIYDQNQVRTDGSGSTGTNVGGTSSEGGSEDNSNGSVADMAKPYNPWTAWDE